MPAGSTDGRKIRFAIVSTARIGLKVCPSIQAAPNATVSVVASRSIERAEEWARAQGVGAWCTYDEVLARDDVDAVYVPIPTGLRHEFLLRAAKAGKHIYSEKPVSGTYEEFKALTEACAAAGVQFMDGTMWVHSKRTREMEARLAAGAIGRVMRVNSAFTFRYPSLEWRNGGDCRTDKTREPLGSFADQGWCVDLWRAAGPCHRTCALAPVSRCCAPPLPLCHVTGTRSPPFCGRTTSSCRPAC